MSIGCSTARPCASVFVMLGELPDANGALKKNSLLFKVYFALSKVFWVLSKALHPLSVVNQMLGELPDAAH